MFGPSSLLAFAVARLWHRAGGAVWRETLEQALAPVSIGLTIASGIAIARSTEHDWAAYAVTAGTTLLLTFTRLHPLVVMAAGAVLLRWSGWLTDASRALVSAAATAAAARPRPPMAIRLGIGIVTYNRKDVLAETLARVRAHTRRQSHAGGGRRRFGRRHRRAACDRRASRW